MNTRNLRAAGELPGVARLQMDATASSAAGTDRQRHHVPADASLDETFEFECDHAAAHALRDLSARLRSDMATIVAVAALGTLSRLHGCEQLRLGVPVTQKVRMDAADADAQCVESRMVATDPANPVAQWIEALGRCAPALDSDASVSLFFGRDEALEAHLQLTTIDDGLQGRLAYARGLFGRADAERYVGYLKRTLRLMAHDETQPLDRIDLLDEAEHAQLAAWNATEVDIPAGQCVHHLFEAQVARTPDAIALRFEEQSLSYAELNRRANRLAHHLIALGVGPDVRVAICAERSLEMVIALYAILKAGGAYVPLDPAYPRERLAYQMEDSAAPLLLAQREVETLIGDATMPILWLEDLSELSTPEHNPAPVGLTPQHMMYVIYTSGSTGKPKGVMNQHDGVVNRLLWGHRQFAFDGRDRVLQKTPFGFDVSVWELFLPLIAGSELVMARPGGHQDRQYLAECIEACRITAVHFVPSMLQAFLDQADLSCCESLRHVMCSGEALPAGLQNRFLDRLPQIGLHNLYGPTEAAVEVSHWQCRPHATWVPIGRPIANTQLHVVDRHLRQVPVGVAGELLIGGVQVARGYLNRPELTEERFIADPFKAGGRVYRTGDLARWHDDGTIEYLGRNDFQVKIRGFRIELGEIESHLCEHPQVHEAVVLAREEHPGDLRLVAYVTAADDAPQPEMLRAHLGARLPQHMVPAAYVLMERWPLSSNGKLDRKALPAPDLGAYALQAYEAPQGPAEVAVAQIWSQMLGHERIGRHDNFFALGGHSLQAIELIERMRRAGLKVDPQALFAEPTLQALAAQAGTHATETVIPANGIAPGCSRIEPHMLPLVTLAQDEIDRIAAAVPGGASNIQDIYPLGPLQEGLLFHYLLESEGDLYLTATALVSDGRERIERYAQALRQVIARHDILRTSFFWDGLAEPVQVVWRDAPLRVEEIELDPGDGDVLTQLRERFDPRHYRADLRQAPLRWLVIARDAPNDRWVALELLHHLIEDRTSADLVQQEVASILAGRGETLPVPVPFREFVGRTRMGISREAHQAYFGRLLGDIDEPTAPFGLVDAFGDGHRTREAHRELSPELGQRLRRVARKAGVSVATLAHLAWAMVLARACDRDDVVFGTVMFGRMHGGDADRAVGLFINTLPVRLRLDGAHVIEGVRRTQEALTGLLRHEHAPLNLAQSCSAVRAPLPLFTSLLNYRHVGHASTIDADDDARAGGHSLAWAGMHPQGDHERSNYPFDISINDRGGDAFSLDAQVDARIEAIGATPERVCAMMETALDSLARALEEAPESALHALEVLPPDARRQVLDAWNRSDATPPASACAQTLFEARAAQRPDAVAVVHGDIDVGYGELNRRANRLAHRLIDSGLKPDDRVAIYLERSVAMVVAILATLKAGGAYVPLDPAYPPERLAYMLGDVGAHTVLTQPRLRSDLPATSAKVIELVGDDSDGEGFADGNPDPTVLGLQPDHLAYVIYTSGSTGLPKGVMIEHRSLVTLVEALEEGYGLREDDRLLQFAALSFDMSVEECFGALCAGSTLVLRDDEWIADPETFWRHCAEQRISVLNLPTAFWHQLADDRGGAVPDSIRQIMIGGEKVNSEMVARWFQRDGHRPRLINAYGPTEATVDATMCVVDGDPEAQASIGKPILHTRIYVLDHHLHPVPAGAVGELYIGGPQVARGYLDRPQLTAERFLPDPFATGGRMYRTGDLGRWRTDGSIEYLGRNDFQVKIRGFRIELGEIEARLAQCPGVREAVVEARDAGGDKRLVGYVEAEPGASIDSEALHAHLAQSLPAYMVPMAYVVLAHMPLTANGKLDRKALPDPGAGAYRTRDYEAPVGALETTVARTWAELLRLERVGRHDNFFELGGHSLLAVTLLSRLRRALAVEVSLKDLFARPVLADLAAHLRAQGHHEQLPIVPTPRDTALPLSHAQERLWFLGQIDGGSEAYHIPMVVRLEGALDVAVLRRALDRIVARHEVLRTTFAREGGRTVQRIAAPDRGFDLRVEDLIGADETRIQQRLDREVVPAFDLRDGPLVRGLLLRIGEDAHALAIVMHHIVSDGWSMGVLTEELNALYAAYLAGEDDPLPPLPIQYADYAVWQRQWLEGDVLEKQSAYWRDALAGAPALLELPTDRPRPAQQSFAGAVEPIAFDAPLTGAIKQLAQRHGATVYMTVLAGWMATLSWLTGQEDIVVGTAVANRMRTEIEGLIGFFVNTQALRASVGGSIAQFVQQVKTRVLDAQDHQDLPFERVVEIVNPERSLAHAPIFQTMLAWQNNDEGELALPGVRATAMDSAHTSAKFDLSLDLAEQDGRIVGHLEFATALFDRATAQRHAGYLQRMMAAMAANDAVALADVDLLGDDERHLVVAEWNRIDAVGVAAANDACIHALFQAQVARAPHAVALTWEGRDIGYAELNRRANRLAHHLIALGVRPDDRVAICVERGLEMVVAVLAVLKAGGAYVPLDPVYPPERIAYMLADSAPVAVLTDAAARIALGTAADTLRVLDLEADAGRWHACSEADPDIEAIGLHPRHLAYIIYTSGSTGMPKGVMIEHANVVRLFDRTSQWFDFGADDVWTLFHSFAFDFSVWEIWGALLHGGRLVVVPYATSRSPGDFYQLLCEQRVTVLNQTPSAFNQLIAAQATSGNAHCLRHVVFGGEALELRSLAPWYQRNAADAPKLANMYGITETTVHVTYHALHPEDLQHYRGRSPIGARIPDLRTYILDPRGRPAPIGATGELYVGGAGVARGYLNRQELTRERFIADPFVEGGRLYRTGDLGRWRSDGTIEYLGRNDFQVKIRGFRIELGEIEARLAQYPGMQEVAVLAREDRPGDKRLVAYFSAATDVGLDDLRRHLGETLPAYMVPAAYVSMQRMPLTANGKLDRKALPPPDADAWLAREYAAPVGPVESALAQIWEDVLKRERVGRNDNFFALGGHSLLLMTLIERMRQIGLKADVRVLFAAPTLQALALEVSGGAEGPQVPPNMIPAGCERIEPRMLPLVALAQADIDRITALVPGGAGNIQDIYPLAPLQAGFLFHYLLESKGDVYLTWTLLGSENRERIDRYAEALQQVVDRHDILRTSVVWDELPEPVQVVWRQARLEVETLDLDPADGDIGQQLVARFHPSHYRFDIRQAPMWKLFVAHDAPNDRWVMLEMIHHLIDDHTTIEFVNQEIHDILEGRADRLRPPQPFRDFIARTRLDAGREEQEAYFRDLLGDVDEPTAPFGLTDVRGDGREIAEATWELDAALCARLRACARAAEVSPAALCHLAWGLVLAHATGRDDVVFGTIMLGRMHAGGERGMGVYINTLPLRIRTGTDGARDGVRRTHRLLTDLLRHEHAPLSLTQRCSAVQPPLPLFSAMLNYRHEVPADAGNGDAAPAQAWNGMQFLRDEERSNYPFDLSINDRLDGRFDFQFQVSSPGIAPERICAMLATALGSLVHALEQAPDTALHALDVLPPDERRMVLGQRDALAPDAPPAHCLHAAFEAHAARDPGAPALILGNERLDYGELNRRANRLAHFLIARGLQRDERVAIFMDRSFDALIGMLAVLKAGGAYVPLDPAYPRERLHYMLADAAPRAVLTVRSLCDALPPGQPGVVALDQDGLAADCADTDPDRDALGLRPHHLAYVIYTSGSTGQPKGVMIEHRQVSAFLHGLADGYRLGPGDRALQFASLSFDASVEECFGALCSGAALVLRDDAWLSDAATFWSHCREHGITHAGVATAFWHQLGAEHFGDIPDTVRYVVIGGEKANPELLARWFHDGRARPSLINSYGPTETTVDATMLAATGDPDRPHAIGRPLRHVRAYVLDTHGQPAPIGVVGELHVGGAQVARGYLDRPELTAERFIASPFVAGDRLYRTGDLVRWHADGSLDYLGRNDFQVKIRGFRIELGEIEARLVAHAQIGEAVVVALDQGSGDLRLVAYVTAAEGQAPEIAALRAHLSATLPAYMVPAAYVLLDRLPVTANGKVDRRALPAPDMHDYARREFEAPSDELETALAELWADTLKRDRIGRRDHFFELGGHSLLAVTMLSRMRGALSLDVSLKDIFAHPVLADLAAQLHGRARREQRAIRPASRDAALPLSHAQQRLWFFSQLEGASEAYHMPMALRLQGALDVPALRRALDRIVARHEVLRTTFARIDGNTVQRIAPADAGLRLAVHDLRDGAEGSLQQRLDDEAGAGFDLVHGPLVRGQLLRVADDVHVLAITMHHIVSDGWSMGIFAEELGALYASYLVDGDDPLPPLPIQYADYALWQHQWLRGDVLEIQGRYWQDVLAGAPALLELPTDRPRPQQQSFVGNAVPVEFDATLTAALRRLAQRQGATVFMVVLAAWTAVLSRLSGQDDIVVGTAVANRTRPEIEPLIGFFVNTQAIRVRLGGDAAPGSVAGLLAQVKTRVLEAQDHQDLPFEQVVEIVNPARNLAHAPIFQVMLAWQNLDEGTLRLPGLDVSDVDAAYRIAKFDLGLDLSEAGDRLVGQLEYASALFDRATVERHVDYLRRMLAAMAADAQRAVAGIALVGEEERAQLLALGDGGKARIDLLPGMHDLYSPILAQARRTPDAPAAIEPGRSIDYRELCERAHGVAWHLRALGVQPRDRVALLADRSIDALIGTLGILAAGAAYVPIDPGYPDERIAYVLDDAGVSALLIPDAHHAAQAERVAQGHDVLSARILAVTAVAPRDDAPVQRTSGSDTAYVIYTSGSTGMPKGVIVPHRGALNLVRGFLAGHDFAGQRVLMIPPLVFDASVGDVFPALSVGSALVLHPSPVDLDARELQRFCAEHRVSAIDAPAALWRRWTDGLVELHGASGEPALPSLRLMMFGGESVPLELVRNFSALTGGRVALNNHYGPTEASVCATMLATHDGSNVHGADIPGAELPIGRPLPGVRVYLLDEGLALVPSGAAGELCIGGLGVADGYQGAASGSARFVPDPFADVAGAKLYRTGDRARWNADGNLQFLGRDDFQVKIRGFRIELGEIEARLAECPGCAEVAVLAREDRPGDKRLVAYVRASGDGTIDIESLHARLSAALPEYMVPAAYVVLDRMPLTINGKIDRKALPAPHADAYLARPYVAPVGATEGVLAGLWSDVLKIDRVGRNDNFFELGGHSLLAVTLIERMRSAGLDVDVRALFAAPTLQALAAEVGAGDATDMAVPDNRIPDGCEAITPEMLPLVALAQAEIDRIVAGVPGGAANVQDIYPLAPLQEILLFHHALDQRGDAFLAPTLHAVSDRAGFDRYIGALQKVIERHDVLRTALAWEGLPEPVQVVWRRAPLVVEEVEPEQGEADVAAWLLRQFNPARVRLDLREAPAWRWYIARDQRNDRWLALELMHHTTGDHTSLQLIHEEVAAILSGREAELPAPVPFHQFIALTRQGTKRAEHEAFFREMLGDIDAPTAPFGLLDTRGNGERIVEAHFELDDGLGQRLRTAARTAGVAPASVCHLAWALLLARACGRDDVVFGTVMFGRMHAGENAGRAMGPLINTLPLRLRVDATPVAEGVRQTHARLTALLRHEHAPISLAHRCSAVPAPQPLFSSLLNYRYQTTGGGDPGAIDGMHALAWSERTNYPLTVSVDDCDDGRIGFSVQVDAVIDPHRVGAAFETALAGLTQALELAPATPLDRLDVLGGNELERVLALGTGAYRDVPWICLHERFQAQAALTPDAPAIAHAGHVTSYGELNRRANRLAHRLIASGIGPEARVGLCLPRCPDLIVAALAVLKAGGAYVALDPDHPHRRLDWILDDSAPHAVIGSASTRATLPETLSATWLTPDDVAVAMEHDPDAVALGLRPDHLAYLIYTSGSTGTPKGVMVEHRNAVNLVTWATDAFGTEALARTLFSSSLDFDLSVFECFAPLSMGGCVELVDDSLALRPDTDACLLNTVPSVLQAWLDAGAIGPHVRTINVAGEALTRELAERVFAQTSAQRLCNLYGPSETTTYSTWVAMERGNAFAPHIGRPIANTRIHVLDAQHRPLPQGAVGEIWIGGAGVARGYLNQPVLTAERFVDDPFVPGERMYRTGDLGRWRNDGTLEYLGRDDFQLKLRGVRIDPGEIEAQLRAHADVHEAVVVMREDVPGDRRLVAYVVGDADRDALRAHLGAVLPRRMMPSTVMRLDRLPTMANGKLDRRSLPAPKAEACESQAFEAPSGATEVALARIWEQMLGHDRVGRHDDFFDLGAHSLLAMQMIGRAHLQGIELALADVFHQPGLAALAATARVSAAPATPSAIVPVRPGDARKGGANVLFLCHDGDRDDPWMHALARQLPAGLPVYGVLAVDSPDPQQVPATATAMREAIRGIQAHGPYRICGWSLGGVLAYEIARQLREEGERIEFLGLVDSLHPSMHRERSEPHAAALHAQDPLQGRAPGDAAHPVADAGIAAQSPLPVLLHELSTHRLLPALGQVLLGEEDVPLDYDPLPIDAVVSVFVAEQRGEGIPSTLGWERCVPASALHLQTVPGNHRSMMQSPRIEVLAGALTAALAIQSSDRLNEAMELPS